MPETEGSPKEPNRLQRLLGSPEFIRIWNSIQYGLFLFLMVYNVYNYAYGKAVDADTYAPVITASKDCISTYFSSQEHIAPACDRRIGDIVFRGYNPPSSALNVTFNLNNFIR